MKHPQVLARHYVDELTGLDVSDLDEIWLERKDIRVIQRECLRCAFPLDSPVLPCSPAVAIDEEGEFRVIEQELAVQTLYVNRLDVLSPSNKVERCVRLVKQRLTLSRLE
jgi:hypothetical protein